MSEQSPRTALWYREPTDIQPFSLFKVLCSSKTDAFVCSAAFPWHLNTLDGELYRGTAADNVVLQEGWKATIRKWSGSVAVGTTGAVYVFRRKGKPLHIKIPPQTQEKAESVVKAVAWGVHPNEPTKVVLIIAASRSLFIYDLSTMSIVGRLRGHGGEITSIAVHPAWPYMFLTTSRDLSTRLYNLCYSPRQVPNNPHWPPNKVPSMAGPAFGLHSSEPEGEGSMGRCVGVLVGNRSGGHRGAVFQATWHPSVDLIATCGMDRTVKIWRVPVVDYQRVNENIEHLAREDKPLFSTDLIHKSRVFAITWLSDDILVSCSAPALMRGETVGDMYEEPGEIVVWQWLAYDRFLKQGHVRPIMRGCIADHRNSESFKIISLYSLPMQTKSVRFFVSPTRAHDPLLLIPFDGEIRVFNISHFTPRPPLEFPFHEINHRGSREEDGIDEDAQLADSLSHTLQVDERAASDEDSRKTTYARQKPQRKLFDEVRGWVVSAEAADNVLNCPSDIESCEMAWGGQAIIGIGKKGTFFHWKLRPPPTSVQN